MKCYYCGMDAVAVCQGCGMGVCKTHANKRELKIHPLGEEFIHVILCPDCAKRRS